MVGAMAGAMCSVGAASGGGGDRTLFRLLRPPVRVARLILRDEMSVTVRRIFWLKGRQGVNHQ